MASQEAAAKRFLKREHELVPFPYKFSLYLLSINEEAQKVNEWQSDSEKWREGPEDYVARLAREIFEAASLVAQASAYEVKFDLRSIVKKKGKGIERRASFPWRERGKARDTDQGSLGELEPATPQGQTSQNMRHIEAMMRLTLETVQTTMENLRSENMDLRKQRNMDDSEWATRRKALEKLLDRGNERDMAVQKLKSEESRKDAMLQVVQQKVLPELMKYAPGVLDAILGKKDALGVPVGGGAPPLVTPPGETNGSPLLEVAGHPLTKAEADLVELTRIFTMIPMDDQIALLTKLSPEDQGKLMTIIERENVPPGSGEKTP